MIPATILRIVLKPTANAAVCAVRSKRTVPPDRPAALTRPAAAAPTPTPARPPPPRPTPGSAPRGPCPPPLGPGPGDVAGREAADRPPDADLAGPLGHA